MTVGELREMLEEFLDHETIALFELREKDGEFEFDKRSRFDVHSVESNSGRICKGPRARLMIVRSE